MIQISLCACALAIAPAWAGPEEESVIVAIRLPPSVAAEPEPETVPLVYADLNPMLLRDTNARAAAEPAFADPVIAYRPVDEAAPPAIPADPAVRRR